MMKINKDKPHISICIPAYKNIVYLKRLLDSIKIQTFKDFEVIITDDSPDSSVHDFVMTYQESFNLQYFRNAPALGTPENWNEGIRKSNGVWIKLMHDDDWFLSATSLQVFYDATVKYKNCNFFFSAFQNIEQETNETKIVRCTFFDLLFLKMSPLHLFKRVYVGNPSCTLVKSNTGLLYDSQFKFVVDFEYYIRLMQQDREYHYIDQTLINVGFNSEQVTKYTFMVPEVQIPENVTLLKKMGQKILVNPFVYDYYWRLFRNLGVRSLHQVESYFPDEIPPALIYMLHSQIKIKPKYLKAGFLSKIFMSLSYLESRFKKII